MQIRCEGVLMARAIAEAMSKLYPSYRHEVHKERGCRLWTIRVYCASTGALLQTRAEV